MKIWQTMKILCNEIQHIQLKLKSDFYRIKNKKIYSLEEKSRKSSLFVKFSFILLTLLSLITNQSFWAGKMLNAVDNIL